MGHGRRGRHDPRPRFRAASIRCIFDGVPTLDLTPDRIVTVARGLISEHGLSDFSMRKLAAALDVNPMTIYLRFDNKDALLDAVARASLARPTHISPPTLRTSVASMATSCSSTPSTSSSTACWPALQRTSHDHR
ncbi:MAG: TetR/AcrR family transcriptional regulator [Actinobacteria bacterium]|nr:TetR/AcrR family transcriptional regulator [Actinomycetota bacterium]